MPCSGRRIWSATICWIEVAAKPWSRSAPNASSRFGPIVCVVPAAASVWQEPHFVTNSCFPRATSPPFTYPPVPQAAATSAMTAARTPARSARHTRASLTSGGCLNARRLDALRRRRAGRRRPGLQLLDVGLGDRHVRRVREALDELAVALDRQLREAGLARRVRDRLRP